MTSLTIIGMDAEPEAPISPRACQALSRSHIVFGAQRWYPRIASLIEEKNWQPWHSPMERSIQAIIRRRDNVVVLASGNPMFYGIGATLCQRLPRRKIIVLPAPSSFDLACARLGWSQQDTLCFSLHDRDVTLLHRWLAPGRRIVTLTTDGTTIQKIADWFVACGYGNSRLDLLENLAAKEERHTHACACTWSKENPISGQASALNVVGVTCLPDDINIHTANGTHILAATPGLPDECFVHDGQLTKRDTRAATLARLMPVHAQLLWDVGAGCGSISIEWMRSDPANRAIAIESHPRRAAMIRANAQALGVPNLIIIHGQAPEALNDLERPDAVFIGGNVQERMIWTKARRALVKGGRIVANALSRDGQNMLLEQHRLHGGDLTLAHSSTLGMIGKTAAWQPHHPLMRYSHIKL